MALALSAQLMSDRSSCLQRRALLATWSLTHFYPSISFCRDCVALTSFVYRPLSDSALVCLFESSCTESEAPARSWRLSPSSTALFTLEAAPSCEVTASSASDRPLTGQGSSSYSAVLCSASSRRHPPSVISPARRLLFAFACVGAASLSGLVADP